MSFFNKAMHTMKKTVSTVTSKDTTLSLSTSEHETQYEIAKVNFERFHNVLLSLQQHTATYLESTMATMSRAAIVTNELANILVEDPNENLFPQWSSPGSTPSHNSQQFSASPPPPGQNTAQSTPSNLPSSEQLERMRVIMATNNENELVRNRKELQNFLSSMRTSHQMFNVDSTFSTFRSTAQRALRAVQDEIDYHGKIFTSMKQRDQLREELVYYSKKVSQMEKDKLKKSGSESSKEKDKFERNVTKKEEIERNFIAMNNDLIRQMNFQYANRGTVLLPFATNFYVSEENWSQSFVAALQQVRSSLPNLQHGNEQLTTIQNDFQKNMNINATAAPPGGYNYTQPPPPSQAPPHLAIQQQEAAEPYNPFFSPVNSYNPESEFVKNGRRASLDKEVNPYDPNQQKVFY